LRKSGKFWIGVAVDEITKRVSHPAYVEAAYFEDAGLGYYYLIAIE
jgi:hypothetical protein